ncbi:unnamed protein product, partial [Ectocarpus sp. 12 AP-2014]
RQALQEVHRTTPNDVQDEGQARGASPAVQPVQTGARRSQSREPGAPASARDAPLCKTAAWANRTPHGVDEFVGVSGETTGCGLVCYHNNSS